MGVPPSPPSSTLLRPAAVVAPSGPLRGPFEACPKRGMSFGQARACPPSVSEGQTEEQTDNAGQIYDKFTKFATDGAKTFTEFTPSYNWVGELTLWPAYFQHWKGINPPRLSPTIALTNIVVKDNNLSFSYNRCHNYSASHIA